MAYNKKKNLILNLEIEDQMSDSLFQIEQYIIEFYKTLFGERHAQQVFLHDNFWHEKYLVTEQFRLDIGKPFTLNELKEAFLGQMSLSTWSRWVHFCILLAISETLFRKIRYFRSLIFSH
jgi:hypothetical protein